MALVHRRMIRATCFRIVKLLLTLWTHSGTDPVRRSAACQGRRHRSSWWKGVQTEEATACPHRTDWNTHTNLGRPYTVCGPAFFFLFRFLSLSLSISLLCLPLVLFFAPSEKWSVLKHVLNITIFTFSCFKKAAKGVVCGVYFSSFFSWKGLGRGLGSVWNFKPFMLICFMILQGTVFTLRVQHLD